MNSHESNEELLGSKRDRQVTVTRPTDDPRWKDGQELIATITVTTGDNGLIWIGTGHTPGTALTVEFLDDDTGEHVDTANGVVAAAIREYLSLGDYRGDHLYEGTIDPDELAEAIVTRMSAVGGVSGIREADQ